MNRFALHGTFVDTPTPDALRVRTGYLLCEDGVCAGFSPDAPAGVPVRDYAGQLITPGLVDLHLHAPQYSYCGTAMDLELLDWLQRYTYPEEAHYADPGYAKLGYGYFVRDLKASATTRACIFATLHTDATLELMHQLKDAGLGAFVGKLAMDRNSPDSYREPSAAAGLAETRRWLDACRAEDMLTRLMYGGRVSLIIGFIVVFMETALGVLFGGLSGYFGGWVDNVIMRVVDVFYCIPSMPVIIIIGAAMDAMHLDSWTRMIYLMLILGFLGWPSIARLVRGQILSLREQEFMMATEACGIKVRHRIFRHLIPNVIPQLIVVCTMGLGSTILTEATLSFLGLGVKYPFASWGNIINDVNNAYVMTNYLFIWIPAGICLLITVLGFNFVGDGLRDAFDPKMKR